MPRYQSNLTAIGLGIYSTAKIHAKHTERSPNLNGASVGAVSRDSLYQFRPELILAMLCLRNSTWLCLRELTSREAFELARDSLLVSDMPETDGRYDKRRSKLSPRASARDWANGDRLRSAGPYQ